MDMPPLKSRPRKPSKYDPKKCPECGGKLDKDGECECGYGCEDCEESKKMEIRISLLLPD